MDSEESSRYLIVRPEKGRFTDLFRYALRGVNDEDNHRSQITTSLDVDVDHRRRWVILVSILVLKLIALFAIPMYWTGRFLDFFLNLISLNGGSFFTLLHNFLHGQSLTHSSSSLLTYLHSSTHFICIFGTANVVLPERGSQTFVSTIGQLDARVDLEKQPFKPQLGNRALMDLCIMSSKLAYENPLFIQNVVNLRWMMHFVAFYDCWNGKSLTVIN
jgi:hypothetical protein